MSDSIISESEVRVLVAEDRAILVVKSETEHGYENILTRRWDDIDDSKRDACAAYLRRYGSADNTDPAIVSMDGPMASRYKRDGIWYFGPVEERRDERTGNVSIWQTLFKSTTTVYAEFIVSDDCSETVTRSLYLNYTSQPNTPDNAPGITYSVSQTLVDPKTGAYTFWIDKSVAKPQTKTYDSLKSQAETAQTVEEKAVATPATSMTPGDGEVRTRNQRVRKDCLVDAETDIKHAENQIENAYEIRADQTSAAIINTQQSASSLPTAPPAPAAGQVKSLKLEPTPYKDRVRTTEETKTAVNQTQTKREVRADMTESVAVNTQVSTDALPTNPPVPDAGQTKSLDIIPTEFKDRAKTVEATRTAINQTITAREVRADETTSATVNTQIADSALPTNPPVPDAGQIKSLKIEPTEFKERNKTTEETRAAIDQTRTIAEVRADQTSAVTIHTQKDVAALPTTPPTPGDGQIKTVQITPTPFKDRAETREETIEGIPQETTFGEVRADQNAAITENTKASAQLVLATETIAGKVVRVLNDPTPFKNRWKTRKEVITPTFVWTGWIPYVDKFGTSYTCGFVNAEESDLTTIKADFTNATNNGLSLRKNEFGRYDGSGSRVASDNTGGGGGDDWNGGFDFIVPECQKSSKFALAKAFVHFTSSKINAQTWINAPSGGGYTTYGTLIDHGAGETTGIRFLGRGRYRVCRVEGKN